MRRIRRTKDKIYQQLVDEGVFNKLKDAFVMAVAIGYKERKREQFDKLEGQFELIRFSDLDKAFMNAIAFAEIENVEILLDENFDERMTIVEEYANYGIDILKRKVLDVPGDPLENLMDYIHEQKEIDKEENSLESMVEDLF